MKTDNIVLFKRFLKTEGANSLFAGMYRQFRPEDAPEDVEVFLREVDAKDAILSAFHFPDKGGQLGFDYWLDKAVKWEKVLNGATASQFYAYCWHNKAKIEREANTPLSVFSAYLHPAGKKSEPSALHRALQTPGGSINDAKQKEEKASLLDATNNSKLDAWVGKEFKKEEPKPVTDDYSGVSEEQMALSGFKMFKMGKYKSAHSSLDGCISVNRKSGYRVCFNLEVSKEINNAKHPYMHVFSKDSALYFLFDNSPEDSIKWRISSNNVVFCNRPLVENIFSFFGIKKDLVYLTISKNMAKTNKNLFYKITQKKES